MAVYLKNFVLIAMQLKSKDGKKPIGRISKQWSGLLKEVFTDTDNFGIQFPLDMDVKMKAVLMGACFLIVRFFELHPVYLLLWSEQMNLFSFFCRLFAGFHVLREGWGGQPTQHCVFITEEIKREDTNSVRARTVASYTFSASVCFSSSFCFFYNPPLIRFQPTWCHPFIHTDQYELMDSFIPDVRQGLFFKVYPNPVSNTDCPVANVPHTPSSLLTFYLFYTSEHTVPQVEM